MAEEKKIVAPSQFPEVKEQEQWAAYELAREGHITKAMVDAGEVREEYEADILEGIADAQKTPGRPIERTGRYQRITLEVADDVLAFIDSQGMSRRAYIEQIVRREMEQ